MSKLITELGDNNNNNNNYNNNNNNNRHVMMLTVRCVCLFIECCLCLPALPKYIFHT